MARDDTPTAVKFGLGVVAGYAFYRLLGWFGGGPGLSGGAPGSGDGAGSGTPPPPPPPKRTPDLQPLVVLVKPSPMNPAGAVLEAEGHPLSVGQLIARIDAGGRKDVAITVRGDVVESSWREIRQALEAMGIQILVRSGRQG